MRFVVIGVLINQSYSVPPHVISPLFDTAEVVGLKEIPMRLEEITPWLKRLSVIVGIVDLVSGDKVPTVKETGPILKHRNKKLSELSLRYLHEACHSSYPKIPSTPWKPWEVDATPMDCFDAVRPEPRVTVSVNSVPLKEPEPYVTD